MITIFELISLLMQLSVVCLMILTILLSFIFFQMKKK